MKTNLLYATSVLGLLAGGLVAASTDAQAQQQSGENRVTLEEITVTARRVEENLMVVPMSVTSMTAKDIEASDFKGMTDISAFTPSFTFHYQVAGQSGFADRSQNDLSFRGLVESPGLTDNGSGNLFIDGAPVSSAQPPALDEIARVEVLKGPQSAYFGRSTFAGAINYVTKDPNMTTFKGVISAEYGSYGSNNESVGLEGPIAVDKLAIRLSGSHDYKGGEYTNAADTNQKMGNQQTDSVSVTLVATPNDNLKVKVWANFFQDNDGPPANSDIKDADGVFNCNPTHGIYVGGYMCGALPNVSHINPQTISGYWTMTPFLQGILVNNNQNFPLTFNPNYLTHAGLRRDDAQGDIKIDYQTHGITITSLTAYHYDKSAEYIDLDFRDSENIPNNFNLILHLPNTLPFYDFNLGVQRLFHDWSQELRFSSAQDQRFRWSFGGNYIRAFIPGFSLYGETAAGPLDLGGITRYVTDTPSLFAGVSYDLMPTLILAAESRYQWDELHVQPVYSGATLLTGAAAAPLNGTFKSFSPRVSLTYKYADDSSIYALWSRGYRPGGFNSYVQTATAAQLAEITALGGNTSLTYKQESLNNFEAGIKATFLDGKARTTLSVYYDQWRNGQIATVLNYDLVPGNPAAGSNQVSPYINAGSIDLDGIEWSGDLLVNKNLKFSSTFGLNNTKVKFFSPCSDATNVTGATSCNGENPHAPKWMWSLSSEYSDHLSGAYDWYARADYSHTGRQFTDYTNLAWTQARDIVNLRLGIRNDVLTIEAYVTNLTNNSAAISSAAEVDPQTYVRFPSVPATNDIRLALPDKRNFGIRAKYNF